MNKLFQFTPLREGRRLRILSTRKMAYFNSRPSARGDDVADVPNQEEQFQFTPLREGRRTEVALRRQREYYFNSRPSARGDLRPDQSCSTSSISIHAPPRGATYLRKNQKR